MRWSPFALCKQMITTRKVRFACVDEIAKWLKKDVYTVCVYCTHISHWLQGKKEIKMLAKIKRNKIGRIKRTEWKASEKYVCVYNNDNCWIGGLKRIQIVTHRSSCVNIFMSYKIAKCWKTNESSNKNMPIMFYAVNYTRCIYV